MWNKKALMKSRRAFTGRRGLSLQTHKRQKNYAPLLFRRLKSALAFPQLP
jgi:hypothetical protein